MRFIYPNMNGNAFVVSRIHRGCCRAIINECQPAGVTVSENVDGCTLFLPTDIFYDIHSVLANTPAEFGVLISDLLSGDEGGLYLVSDMARGGTDRI
jgi:hypothetical protein